MGKVYCGVYDLYDWDGSLLFCGFSKFHYNSKYKCYVFLLGGYWDEVVYSEPDELDFYNGVAYWDCGMEFINGFGRWLILDDKFNSVVRDSNGSQVRIEKGFNVITNTIKCGKSSVFKYDHRFNVPCEILSGGVQAIEEDFIILSEYNLEDSRQNAIEIMTGRQTDYYMKITQASGKFLYAAGDDGILSIIDIDGNIFIDGYMFFTRPQQEYFLGIKKNNEGKYRVDLLKLPELESAVLNVALIELDSLDRVECYLKKGLLRLVDCCETDGCLAIKVCDKRVFDENAVSKLEGKGILIKEAEGGITINDEYYFPSIPDYTEGLVSPDYPEDWGW